MRGQIGCAVIGYGPAFNMGRQHDEWIERTEGLKEEVGRPLLRLGGAHAGLAPYDRPLESGGRGRLRTQTGVEPHDHRRPCRGPNLLRGWNRGRCAGLHHHCSSQAEMGHLGDERSHHLHKPTGHKVVPEGRGNVKEERVEPNPTDYGAFYRNLAAHLLRGRSWP